MIISERTITIINKCNVMYCCNNYTNHDDFMYTFLAVISLYRQG